MLQDMLQAQLPHLVQFEQKQYQAVHTQGRTHEDGRERIPERLITSSLESGTRTAATKSQEKEIAQPSLEPSQNTVQKEGLIERYVALKNERNQYNAITANPEEKKHMVSLRSQIAKTAFEITQNKALMEVAQQQGLAKTIKLESSQYVKSLEQNKDRGRGMGL